MQHLTIFQVFVQGKFVFQHPTMVKNKNCLNPFPKKIIIITLHCVIRGESHSLIAFQLHINCNICCTATHSYTSWNNCVLHGNCKTIAQKLQMYCTDIAIMKPDCSVSWTINSHLQLT